VVEVGVLVLLTEEDLDLEEDGADWADGVD
jgi:hypothetical protein